MQNKLAENSLARSNRPGIALMITLVILIVLSAMAYTLSAKVAAQKHRNQYLIDYQSARYGCDSAVRVAIAKLEQMDPNLVSRPNEPDFSDLFHYTPQQYKQYMQSWKDHMLTYGLTSDFKTKNEDAFADLENFDDSQPQYDSQQELTVPGPYGPPWPLVAEPLEVNIGKAKVTIEIEDENAKYPLGWAMLEDENKIREAQVAFETFFQWWPNDDANNLQTKIFDLYDQLELIKPLKPFQVTFEDKTVVRRMAVSSPTARRNALRNRSAYRGLRTANRKVRISKEQQYIDQCITFAKLFHSSLIDTEALARPIIKGEDRKESPLKYMALWGSKTVNVNTAPRNVLEAAFTFGGYPDKIADEIVLRRQMQPFTSVNQLKESLFGYSNSIDKCKDLITASSNYFTIKVTSVCGVAKVSVVVAIMKNGSNVRKIAIFSS